jgi:hypothetical protein
MSSFSLSKPSVLLSKLCTPAVIYLVFSAITILTIVLQKVSAVAIIVKMLFVGIWTWFLNYLCSKGYSWISWGMVFLPFILLLLNLIICVEVLAKVGNINHHPNNRLNE